MSGRKKKRSGRPFGGNLPPASRAPASDSGSAAVAEPGQPDSNPPSARTDPPVVQAEAPVAAAPVEAPVVAAAPAETPPLPGTTWVFAPPAPVHAPVTAKSVVVPPAESLSPKLAEDYAALQSRLPVDAPGAVEEYRFFREKANLAKNARLLAQCTIDLGAAYDAAGDAANARIEFQRVVAYGAAAGEAALVGTAKDWLGLLAQSEERYEDALRLHLEALGALRKSGKPQPLSRCLNNLGMLRAREEDLRDAIECFREARDLRAAAGDRSGVARLEANLGVACLGLDRDADAATHFRSALAIMDGMRDDFAGAGQELVAAVCTNLAVCAEASGRLEEAGALSARAAAIYSDRGNSRGLADARHNGGYAALRVGDNDGAVREFNLSAEAGASAGERALAAQSIFNIAVAQARGGNADQARKTCQAARAEFAHTADPDGGRRTQELLDVLPNANQSDVLEKILGMAYPMRKRRTFQAARFSA
ncbi:MAG: hypothetical protein FD180_954 [Planctomycetota bacterium]|nr:MAG: hypothetical protein FD180_954 [Planctomycetota bacterium]